MPHCRVCAFESDDTVSIFEAEGEELFLAQKINDYLPIQVTSSDPLSLVVCRNCTTFLVAWDDLYTTCREADHQLKTAYEDACNELPSNEVDWNNKNREHDHSYNKNETGQQDEETVDDDQQHIIIQSVDANNEILEDSVVMVENQTQNQVANVPPEDEVPRKKRKVLHFEVLSSQGGTFSVSSLEMHQDDDDIENNEVENDDIEFVEELGEDDNEEAAEEERENNPDEESASDMVSQFNLVDIKEEYDEVGGGEEAEGEEDDSSQPPVGRARPSAHSQKKPSITHDFRECDICHVVCNGSMAYIKHRKSHPPEVRLKCPVCSKMSPNDSSHKSHVRIHTDNLHPCDLCGRVLSSRSSLAVHKLTHNREPRYQCQICGKTTMTQAKLREHLQIHSDTRPFSCTECGHSFKTQQCLKQHSATHNKQPLFVCDICGYSCHRRNHLTKHIANRHSNPNEEKKPRMYTCCICNEQFSSRIPLMQHVTEEHPAEDVAATKTDSFECKQCGKILATKAGYHCHMATHSGRRHSCSFCSRSFATSKSLRYHILDHTGEKPFSCRTCGQRFKGQWLLQRHERVHTGERPYKCAQCPMAFRCSMTLYQHKQIHSTVKKYKCAFCTYQTSRAEALRIHLRVHTDERPYPCNICGWAFKQKSDCSKHMALHTRPQGIKRQIKKMPQRRLQIMLEIPSNDEMNDKSENADDAAIYLEEDPLETDLKTQTLLTMEDSQLSMPDNADSCD